MFAVLIGSIFAQSCQQMQIDGMARAAAVCNPPQRAPTRAEFIQYSCSQTCLDTLVSIFSVDNQLKFYEVCKPNEVQKQNYLQQLKDIESQKSAECNTTLTFPVPPQAIVTSGDARVQLIGLAMLFPFVL
jgi:hypothetical protein